jgi:Fic family protein
MAIQKLLDRADFLKNKFQKNRIELDNERIRAAFQVEFIYESNRIEGNTLTLRETKMVIQDGLTVGGKSIVEHLEAINHLEAVYFLEDLVQKRLDFNEFQLKQLHGLILHGIDRENTGTYRKVPVMISGSQHLPPQPWALQALMEAYFIFYETEKNQLHPILLAAEMHERLVNIHPFIDGNGRTSRLVMNLILGQHGFPFAIIGGDFETRMTYYQALENAHIDPQKVDFQRFICEKVIDSLEKYLTVFGISDVN